MKNSIISSCNPRDGKIHIYGRSSHGWCRDLCTGNRSCRFCTEEKISNKQLIARGEEEEEEQGNYWKRRLKVSETGQLIYSSAILFLGGFHNCVKKHGSCVWLNSPPMRSVELWRREYSGNIHSVRYTWRMKLELDVHAGIIIQTRIAAIEKVNPAQTAGGSHHHGNI